MGDAEISVRLIFDFEGHRAPYGLALDERLHSTAHSLPSTLALFPFFRPGADFGLR